MDRQDTQHDTSMPPHLVVHVTKVTHWTCYNPGEFSILSRSSKRVREQERKRSQVSALRVCGEEEEKREIQKKDITIAT